MEKLRIIGGNRLSGSVRISGAKNAVLPILAASLLTADELVLHNVPHLADVKTMLSLLEGMGVTCHQDGETVRLCAANVTSTVAPYELVKTMRASILVLCPLATRFGSARVSLPGGCTIGARPVDQHIQALLKMGADVQIDHGFVDLKSGRLQGTKIVTDMVTVTGTENIMMAAVLAEGRTVIENAAREPEVVDLANCLRAMGAKIEGDGTSTIVIDGCDSLHGAEHSVIPDRIEAGTFMASGKSGSYPLVVAPRSLAAAAATKGDVTLTNVAPDTLSVVIDKIREAGAEIETGPDWIHVTMNRRPKSVSIRTEPHPGFPTDMQAQIMALDCVADGTAQITETIFENRFMHVPELQRLGADIQVEGHTAVVRGVEQLQGARLMATDLRASASLVIAALAAEGESTVFITLTAATTAWS